MRPVSSSLLLAVIPRAPALSSSPPLTQGFSRPPKFGKAVNKVLHITEASAMQRAPALTITLGHVLSCQCPEVTVKSGLGYYEEAWTQNILVFGWVLESFYKDREQVQWILWIPHVAEHLSFLHSIAPHTFLEDLPHANTLDQMLGTDTRWRQDHCSQATQSPVGETDPKSVNYKQNSTLGDRDKHSVLREEWRGSAQWAWMESEKVFWIGCWWLSRS